MATSVFNVTNTQIDVVASQSLATGRYILQNVGTSRVWVNSQDDVLMNPAALNTGHVLAPEGYIGLDVASDEAIYVWTVQEGNVSRLAVTEE